MDRYEYKGANPSHLGFQPRAKRQLRLPQAVWCPGGTAFPETATWAPTFFKVKRISVYDTPPFDGQTLVWSVAENAYETKPTTGTMRTLRIVGTGDHHLTKILDAETGEDIGVQLAIRHIEYRIGDKDVYPNGRLILELGCPVILEIQPPYD